MIKILKFPLQFKFEQTIPCSKNHFRLLDIQVQQGIPVLWVEADADNLKAFFTVKMAFTGDEVPEPYIYFKTIQNQELVWHVYV